MTSTYFEISLLKLVLADYLQVLELHLFAILQMRKTLMLSTARGYFNPQITLAVIKSHIYLFEGGANV